MGSFTVAAPVAYQEMRGRRVGVPVRFGVREDRGAEGVTFGFDVGPYDPRHPLVIDPVMLVY